MRYATLFGAALLAAGCVSTGPPEPTSVGAGTVTFNRALTGAYATPMRVYNMRAGELCGPERYAKLVSTDTYRQHELMSPEQTLVYECEDY